MKNSEDDEFDKQKFEKMLQCDGVIIPEDLDELPKFDEKGNLLDNEGNIIPDSLDEWQMRTVEQNL